MKIVGCIGLILGALGLIAIQAVWLMLLWNWTMPELFGLPPVSWLQMLGLFFLVNGLFKWQEAGKSLKNHMER
jgi:hypothetical protein